MSEYFDSTQNRVVAGSLAKSSQVNDMRDETGVGFDRLPASEDMKSGKLSYAADTGTANAYAVAMANTRTAYEEGLTVRFNPANANTGASTLNVDSIGPVAIKRPDGTDVQAGDLIVGQIVELVYNNANFVFTGNIPNSWYAEADTARTEAQTAASGASTSEANALTYRNAAQTAQTGAETAQTAAETAQSGAVTAQGAAETAQGLAETAQTAAETAQTAAETAKTGAETAQTAAETAKTGAETAQTGAQTAETNATNAKTAAQTAQSAAETAQGLAETAQGAAETAQTGAETAETNAGTSESNALTYRNEAQTARTASETAQGLAENAQTAAETAQANAETVYDNFDDRYLGQKTSDPSVDNDGAALLTGALYWNTTNNKMMAYNGSAWEAAYINYQWEFYSSATNDLAVPFHGYLVDATAANRGLQLPASSNIGDRIFVKDHKGTVGTYKISIWPNGNTIENSASQLELTIANDYVELVSDGAGNWSIIQRLYGYAVYS